MAMGGRLRLITEVDRPLNLIRDLYKSIPSAKVTSPSSVNI
jgi:hypothetical protein